MTIDMNVMRRLATNYYMSEIRQVYGEPGETALLEIFERLPRVYEHVDPEGISGRLSVFRALNDDSPGTAVIQAASNAPPTRLWNLGQLTRGYTDEARRKHSVIQVCRTGDLSLWTVEDLDMEVLAKHGVIYTYRARTDSVQVNGVNREMLNPDRSYASVFAIPTFRYLREALEYYKTDMIRTSGCQIFSRAWEEGSSNDRLFFRSKPEHIMRDSLTQFLKISLRGVAEVRPEQVMDESHPVDIKVTWTLNKKLALIEVKWLGKIRNHEGRVTQAYSASRAREGAGQLAGYLDANATQAPTHETKGYLVVIDARRHGLNENSKSIDRANGMRYAEDEIEYDPKHHKIRLDFEEPIRMFAEPVCRQP